MSFSNNVFKIHLQVHDAKTKQCGKELIQSPVWLDTKLKKIKDDFQRDSLEGKRKEGQKTAFFLHSNIVFNDHFGAGCLGY